MQWHEFIFSEKKKHKLLRHFCFLDSMVVVFFIMLLFVSATITRLATRSSHLRDPWSLIFF